MPRTTNRMRFFPWSTQDAPGRFTSSTPVGFIQGVPHHKPNGVFPLGSSRMSLAGSPQVNRLGSFRMSQNFPHPVHPGGTATRFRRQTSLSGLRSWHQVHCGRRYPHRLLCWYRGRGYFRLQVTVGVHVYICLRDVVEGQTGYRLRRRACCRYKK